MPFLGERSLHQLSTGHWYLQKIAQRAIQKTDFSIIEGYRSDEDQTKAFIAGRSKLPAGKSAHNKKPSNAVDIIPYPFIGWDDKASFKKVKDAFKTAMDELITEGELPVDFDLEFGLDWGWDSPHIEIKGWNKHT